MVKGVRLVNQSKSTCRVINGTVDALIIVSP